MSRRYFRAGQKRTQRELPRKKSKDNEAHHSGQGAGDLMIVKPPAWSNGMSRRYFFARVRSAPKGNSRAKEQG
jgi:hypothetical protein